MKRRIILGVVMLVIGSVFAFLSIDTTCYFESGCSNPLGSYSVWGGGFGILVFAVGLMLVLYRPIGLRPRMIPK